MATTKVNTVIWNDVTLTAGAGDTTSDTQNLADGYGGTLYMKITNGATGPTVGAQIAVWYSPDGTNWYSRAGGYVSTLGNNVVTSWTVDVPIGVAYLRLVAGSNTVQNVTVRAELTEVSAVA